MTSLAIVELLPPFHPERLRWQISPFLVHETQLFSGTFRRAPPVTDVFPPSARAAASQGGILMTEGGTNSLCLHTQARTHAHGIDTRAPVNPLALTGAFMPLGDIKTSA